MSNTDLSAFINLLPDENILDDDDLDMALMSEYAYGNCEENSDDINMQIYTRLCNDDNLASYTRQYLIQHNDTTNSRTIDEVYLKNLILNKNKVLIDVAKREYDYEQSWQK